MRQPVIQHAVHAVATQPERTSFPAASSLYGISF